MMNDESEKFTMNKTDGTHAVAQKYENRPLSFPLEKFECIEWIREHEQKDVQFQWKQQQKIIDLQRANEELLAKLKEAEVLKNNLQQIYNSEQVDLLCKLPLFYLNNKIIFFCSFSECSSFPK
jgi:hypothetical protein